jgi:hypothetical protein
MRHPKNMRSYATISLLLLALLISPARADPLDQRLLGAWAPSGSECKELFESKGGRIAFRQPIDTFTTAFIIRPPEIRATTGSCRLGNASSAKGYLTIPLSCENSVGYIPLSARVKIISATQITYGDAGVDPLLDSTYKKCAL